MDNKRLLKKTGFYFIGNLSSKILSVILVPLYAFYITSNDLGQYDYSQTLINILVPIFFMNIWEAVLKFILAEKNEEKENKIMSTTIAFVFMVAIILLIAMNIYGKIIEEKYIGYISIMFVSYGITVVWQYYARAKNENKLYVKAAILGTITNFLLNVIMICIFNIKIEALYISYIMSNIVIFLVIEMRLKVLKDIKKKNVELSILKKMLAFSFPLVINTISVWLISGFGRVYITSKLGTELNGLYAFANKFSVVVTFFGSVLNMAMIEEAIIIGKEDKLDNKFAKTTQIIFEKFLEALIVALPVIYIFYEIIQNTEYYISRVYVPVLLIYSLLMTMATNIASTLQAENKTKYIFSTTLVGSFFTVIISIIFINKIGIYSVLVGQLLGAFSMLVSRYFLVKKITGMKISWKKIMVLFAIYIIVSYCMLQTNIYIYVCMLLVLLALCIYDNKSYIHIIKNKLIRSKK